MDRAQFKAQRLMSLGELSAALIHDFNNVLNVVLGNASLAEMYASDKPLQAQSCLDEIQRAGEQAAELCRELMGYSHCGSSDPVACHLGDLIEGHRRLLDVMVSKRARLELRLAEDLPTFEGEEDQLKQLLLTLVSSAVKALGSVSGGSLHIGTSVCQLESGDFEEVDPASPWDVRLATESGEALVLEVRSDRRGAVPMAELVSADPMALQVPSDLGLGPAVCREIVRLHGGGLIVKSDPERGMRARAVFPTSGRATESLTQGEQRVRTSESAAHRLVLVVDDERAPRKVAAAMLENMGYEVLVAENGEQALEVYASAGGHIALVLLDMTMPKWDGEETFRRLKEHDPQVRAILMSGIDEREMVAHVAELGLVGFIQKPFRLKALSAKLDEILPLES